MKIKTLIYLSLAFASIFELKAQTIVQSLSQISSSGVILSHLPGYHKQNISITASHPVGVNLRYTLNGNYPDLQSPIFPDQLTADTVMALSVRKEINGQLNDTVFTGLYLVKFNSTLPVASLILPGAYFFDPSTGIYTGGLINGIETYGKCWSNVEKPVYFEYYPDETNALLSQHCGVGIFGGMTRGYPEKSLRLTARKKYGKGKFKGELFSTKPIQSFNSLILRMSGNDYMSTRFQDIMISSLAKDLDIDHMAYQPSVLFLNGTYWGIYNLREKIDRDYFKHNHGCEKDSLQMIEGNTSAKYGSSKEYKNLISYLINTSPNNTAFVNRVDECMDIKNFFNYQILQIHIFNVDYRGNIRFWRCPPNNNKFKWIYYDGDLGFNRSKINFLQKRLSETETDWYNPTWSTLILRKLVQNKTLKNQFINQYCYLLSTTLSRDTITSRINFFQNWIRPEISRHLTRRNFRQSIKTWESKVQNLREFAKERELSSFENLKSVFLLKSSYKLQIDANIPQTDFGLKINENLVPKLPYQGQYFGEVPLSISVEAFNPLYRFKRWSDGYSQPERTIIQDSDQTLNITALFEKQVVSSFAKSIQIQTIHAGSTSSNHWIEIHRKQVDAKDFEGKIWDIKNKRQYSIRIASDKSIVIAKDTAIWRSTYPGFLGQLIQMPNLECSGISLEFCLVENKGAIVDYFIFNAPQHSVEMPAFYLIREGGSVISTIKPPDFTKKVDNNSLTFWRKNTLLITLLFSAICLLLFFFIRFLYRTMKRKKYVDKK